MVVARVIRDEQANGPLPVLVVLGGRLHQPHTGIGDDQPHTRQASILQVFEKGTPAGLVLLVALRNPQHLTITVCADTDSHQHRDVPDLTGPAAL